MCVLCSHSSAHDTGLLRNTCFYAVCIAQSIERNVEVAIDTENHWPITTARVM
jgi:hypothetical protein